MNLDDKIKVDDILKDIPDDAPDPKQKEWKYTLPAQEKAGPVTVSVLFTTVTGAKAVTTETITFGPPPKKLYTIKGQVVRGMLGQKDLEVVLMDIKRNVKDKAKTGDKGVFEFQNVEPGTYIVTSKEGAQNLYGETKPITVPDKEKKEINVTVSLYVK